MLDQDSALHDRVGSRTGLVLSGGGARGAYEIGVIAGFIEILDKRAGEHPPFEVFAGTSIGALNSALLASRADRGDLDIDALVNFWHQFQLEEYLKIERLNAKLDSYDYSLAKATVSRTVPATLPSL